MMKTRVQCAGIDVVREAHLLDAPLSLKIRMLYQLEQQSVGNADKTVHRVVENLGFTHVVLNGVAR